MVFPGGQRNVVALRTAVGKHHYRKALNEIAECLDQIYETESLRIFPDPYEMRDEYIKVMLGDMTIEEFGKKYSGS